MFGLTDLHAHFGIPSRILTVIQGNLLEFLRMNR